MTAPTTYFSKSTDVKLDNAAGSLVALEGYFASVSMERSFGTDGATALSDRNDGHTVAIEEPGEIQGSGPYHSTLLRHMAGIWGATATQTAELHPGGATASLRKGSVETVMTGIELSWDIDSTIQLSTTHKCSGAWTFADN